MEPATPAAGTAGEVLPRLLPALCLVVGAYHLAANWYGLLQPLLHTATHLGMVAVLAFLITAGKGLPGLRGTAANLLLAVAAGGAFFYVSFNFIAIQERGIFPEPLDIACAIVAIVAVLEATRRFYGPPLPLIAIVVIAYGFAGDLLPPDWRHATWDLQLMTFNLFMGYEGLFGSASRISATLIFTFVMLGAFLERVGATERIIALATALTAGQAGAPAKVAVIASGMMGTVSGSAVANVVATGRFTIPFMMRAGYRPPFAAAVEAVASTGGLLMPPIMGAGAFVMAEVLGISYWTIASAAAVPALLYYVAVFAAVHAEAKRRGLGSSAREEALGAVVRRSVPFLLPLVVLLGFIAVDVPPITAALYTMIATVALGAVLVRPAHPRLVLDAIILGSREAVPVAIACACAGLIVGALTGTGFAIKFSGLLVDLAGENRFLALVMAMLVVIFLGMALPATASYLIGAAVVAPPLIGMGFPPLAVHMFVFYYSNLSHITPPVDLATYAAAGLARANPLTASFHAVALGSIAFVLPFVFIHYPVLLLIDFAWIPFLEVLLPALVGTVVLACGTAGWLRRPLPVAARIVLVAAGMLLIQPDLLLGLPGLAAVVAVWAWARPGPAAAPDRVAP